MAVESVRPATPDDIVIPVRVNRHSLAALREGVECLHVRLDKLPDRHVFDIYVETAQQRPSPGAVEAWDAPHSPGFNPDPLAEAFRLPSAPGSPPDMGGAS